MPKTIIHVHQQVIARNRKTGSNMPPLTVKTYKTQKNTHFAMIMGPSLVVHSPHKPLPCGARVWIETNGDVLCDESILAVNESEVSRTICREGLCGSGRTATSRSKAAAARTSKSRRSSRARK